MCRSCQRYGFVICSLLFGFSSWHVCEYDDDLMVGLFNKNLHSQFRMNFGHYVVCKTSNNSNNLVKITVGHNIYKNSVVIKPNYEKNVQAAQFVCDIIWTGNFSIGYNILHYGCPCPISLVLLFLFHFNSQISK